MCNLDNYIFRQPIIHNKYFLYYWLPIGVKIIHGISAAIFTCSALRICAYHAFNLYIASSLSLLAARPIKAFNLYHRGAC